MSDEPLPGDKPRCPIRQVKLHRLSIPSDELLEDLRRVASELSARTVSKTQYEQRGYFTCATCRIRFGTWNAALVAAGLEVGRQKNIPATDLMENFAQVWLKLGRQPIITDLRREISKYSSAPYVHRYGNFMNVLVAFAEWAGAKVCLGKRPADDSSPFPKPARKLTPRQPNGRQRIQVLMRDQSTCRLCGARPDDGARLEIDHIIPWSKGGETVLENLQVLCHRCNREKRDFENNPGPQGQSE